MKIRNDFVSNSSSSSFIIDNVKDITSQIPFKDFEIAIRSCFDMKLYEPDLRIYNLDDQQSYLNAITVEKKFLTGWIDNMNPKLSIYNDTCRILKDFGRVNYDRNKDAWQQADQPLERPIIQALNILKTNMGISYMTELLESKFGKILICMSENLIWKAIDINTSCKKGYKTDPMTADRFCELIARKLWEMGYEGIDYCDLRFCFHGHQHMG